MNSDGNSAASVAAAMRDGAVLSAAEAVALAYESCRQVKHGLAARIPSHPSEIEITDDGHVLITASGPMWLSGPALATLLSALLPTDGAVPSALRTLPARLLGAVAPPGSPLDDQLTILRWHLRGAPEPILRRLGARLGTPNEFEWDAPPVAPARGSAPLSARVPLFAAVSAPARRTLTYRRLFVVLAATLLLALSGYGGFRLTELRSKGVVSTSSTLLLVPSNEGPAPLAGSTISPR